MTGEEFREKLAAFIDATPDEQGSIIEALATAYDEALANYENTRKAYVKAFMTKKEEPEKEEPSEKEEETLQNKTPTVEEAVRAYVESKQ